MDIPELSFQLNIDCEADFEVFKIRFRDICSDSVVEWQKSGVGSSPENWIELERNFDYDPILKKGSDEWVHYPYIVHVFTKKNPSPNMEDFNNQLKFARFLIAEIKKLGYSVKLNAEFETLI